jgi:hypothetical protein
VKRLPRLSDETPQRHPLGVPVVQLEKCLDRFRFGGHVNSKKELDLSTAGQNVFQFLLY